VLARAVCAEIEPNRWGVGTLRDRRFLRVGIRLQPGDPAAGTANFRRREFRCISHRIDSKKQSHSEFVGWEPGRLNAPTLKRPG